MMINKDNMESLPEDIELPKDVLNKFYIPRAMTKKTPGAILSWAIPAANKV